MSDTGAWMPAGLAERLRVGARVRVRISLECAWTPHWPWQDGQESTIFTINPLPSGGHDFWVGVTEPDGRLAFYRFAASELEPIDAEPID